MMINSSKQRVLYFFLSLTLCVVICSCKGKLGKKAIEIVEKTIKGGADDAVRVGINGVTNAIRNKDNEDHEDYFEECDEYDEQDEYGNIDTQGGQFIISEESGDLIYIDEYGDAHQAYVDEYGNPQIYE